MKRLRSIEVPIHTASQNYQMIVPEDGTVWVDGTDSPNQEASGELQRAKQWVTECGGRIVAYYITGNIIENASTMTLTYRSLPPRGTSASNTAGMTGPAIGKQGGNLIRAPIRFRLPVPPSGVLVQYGLTTPTGITTILEVEYEDESH